jgi:hypothetical protein
LPSIKAFIFEIFCFGGSGGLLGNLAMLKGSVLGVWACLPFLGSLLILTFSEIDENYVILSLFLLGLSMLKVISFW